jgi:hypothetical protein
MNRRMLGRYRVPGCCPGAREGRPGPDCAGGSPVGTRIAKRREQRIVKAAIDDELCPPPAIDDLVAIGAWTELETLAGECRHGCSGSPSCTQPECTFTCHAVT